MAAAHAYAKDSVDIVAGPGTGCSQLFGSLFQVFDLEPNVMDAAPGFATLDPRHLVILKIENGQIDVAIAEVIASGVGVINLANFLQAKNFDIKLGRLLRILWGNGTA